MNKQKIYDYLSGRGIQFEITEHRAVYNMDDLRDVAMPYPDQDAKNLFVRDNKKLNYYLITVRGSKRVDLKAFRTAYNTRPLSFASEEELYGILGLTPGSVSPLGILNDSDRRVTLYLDRSLLEPPSTVGVHPNDNTATVWLKTEDLISIITDHGNRVEIAEL